MSGPAEVHPSEWTDMLAELTRLRRIRDDLRRYFEVYDLPCEPDRMWRHVEEYASIDARLRDAVGAPSKAELDAEIRESSSPSPAPLDAVERLKRDVSLWLKLGGDHEAHLSEVEWRLARLRQSMTPSLSSDDLTQLSHHLETHRATCASSCAIIEKLMKLSAVPR